MREVRVDAATVDEALADGAAALGIRPRLAQVEVLSADEDGVTARVWIEDEADQAEPEVAAVEEAVEDEPLPTAPGPLARAHLQKMLDLMGVDAGAVLVSESEDEVALDVAGEDLGVIIGSCGQTLNSVQFLLNLMVNRGTRRRRITVDAEGYRDRRRVRLEELAQEHARRAKSERREVILEGLRAAERRIIHTALQDNPDVVTYSEGDEPHRRLIISPRTT